MSKRLRLLRLNAKKDRFIYVTEQDLTKAICKDHQNCVIAKAIKRVTGAKWVDVGAATVLVKRKYSSSADRYILDAVGQAQVRFFDKEGKFAPCYVRLRAPGFDPRNGIPRKNKPKLPTANRKRRTLATR